MSCQPSTEDLRVIAKDTKSTCAVAIKGPHYGKRFVRTGTSAWLPAGNATKEELGMLGTLHDLFDGFKRKGGAV